MAAQSNFEMMRRNRFFLTPSAVKDRDSFTSSMLSCELPAFSYHVESRKMVCEPIEARLFCYLSADPFAWVGDFLDRGGSDFTLEMLGPGLEPNGPNNKILGLRNCKVDVHFDTLTYDSEGEVVKCNLTIHPGALVLPDGRSYDLTLMK